MYRRRFKVRCLAFATSLAIAAFGLGLLAGYALRHPAEISDALTLRFAP